MNRRLKKIRWIYVSFLTFIIISVPIDTYILGGKIKLWIVAITGLMAIFHFLFGRSEKKEDVDKEDEVVEG